MYVGYTIFRVFTETESGSIGEILLLLFSQLYPRSVQCTGSKVLRGREQGMLFKGVSSPWGHFLIRKEKEVLEWKKGVCEAG